MNEFKRFQELAGIEEDSTKVTPEDIEKYWITMIEQQPESVIDTLTNLTIGALPYNNFVEATKEDVYDSYRDKYEK